MLKVNAYLSETLWGATDENVPEQVDIVLVGEDTECGTVDEGPSLLRVVKHLTGQDETK